MFKRPRDQWGLITGEWTIWGGRSRGNTATLRLSPLFEKLRKNPKNRGLTVLIEFLKIQDWHITIFCT